MHPTFVTHKVGLTLSPHHYSYLEQKPDTEVSWFEAVSEKHMYSRGLDFEMLQLIRQDYPVALRGTSMNVGCASGIRSSYLQKLRELIDQIDPFIVSDNLCWSGTAEINLNSPLPLPFTKESIRCLADNIDHAQNFLRRPIIFKNISTYITYRENEMTEWEFINEVLIRTGCHLLLDLNNLYINAYNHRLNLKDSLMQVPWSRVAEVQVAGPMEFRDFLYDSRSQNIPEVIWDLFEFIAPKIRHLPVMISREEDVPHFSELEMEVLKAVLILENSYEIVPNSEIV